MKKLFFACFTALFFVACGQQTDPATEAANANPNDPNEYFGDKITPDNAMELKALLAKMENTDSVQTKVIGTVESVCKKKGCWMNIVADGMDKELFVKFKDYEFFMPLDCEGRRMVMEGIAYREVTSVDELRHYAEDEGKSKEEIEAITEPMEELKFMASGVVMLPKEN